MFESHIESFKKSLLPVKYIFKLTSQLFLNINFNSFKQKSIFKIF